MMKFEAMAPGSGVLLYVTPDQVERNVHAPIDQLLARKAAWRWLHLDHNRPAARDWLRTQRDLPEDIADAMLADRTRPRCSVWQSGLMFIGRGVNLNDSALPEDMVSIRAWLTADRLVTVVLRRVRAAEDVAKSLEAHEPRVSAHSSGELLLMLLENLIERMTPIVYESGEQLDDVLEQIVEESPTADRQELTKLRLRIMTLRRYALPLRDAINQLRDAPAELMPTDLSQAIANLSDRTTRLYEELEALNARAEVARGEMSSEEAETLNRRLYALAIITAIFLPLSFLTGLLGMNVAGIPFTSQPWAFWVWGIVFAGVLCGQLVALRRLGWL
ncbi:MAG: CorA family divalent cation transporter [Planctomycetota bacterium]